MKVIQKITAYVKKPKVNDQFCGWGIGGKSGFSCEYIEKVTKRYLILSTGEKISIERWCNSEIHTAGTKQKIEMKITE